MAEMGRYTKAYTVEKLRAFDGFEPDLNALSPGEDDAARTELADDDVLFVHEDFAVTDGIYRDENVVFGPGDEAWKTFCTDSLGFAVPEDVAALPVA